MTETTETTETETTKAAKGGKKKLSLSRPGKLELKKTVEGGQVRQNFSHGRSKVVTVEVRKKRTFQKDGDGGMHEVRRAAAAAEAVEAETALDESVSEAEAPPAPAEAPRQIKSLTEEEKAARARALQDSIRRGEEAVEKAKAEAARLARESEEAAARNEVIDNEEERRKAEEEARVAEEAARKLKEEEARRLAEEEEKRREEKGRAAAAAGIAKLEALDREAPEEEDAEKPARGRRGKTPLRRPTPGVRRGEPRRRAGKLTIAEALDDNERVRSLASVKRAREKERLKENLTENQKIIREVTIPETIMVQELAARMAERGVDVVKAMMKMGVMANVNQVIDADTAELVATELGHKTKRVSAADVEIGMMGADDRETELKPRPPVVTVMGHVDHGKTSLLDALRQSDVAAHEAGGITQHIGAYQVTTEGGARITFIDTPGHEAFTAMRARGAKVTDIVVLVVAADDGIMPQTVEAIDHAKAAEVPIIVAINKIDRPDANPDRVRTQLLEHELVLEKMGGEVLDVEVSAIEKIGLDKLEETILLQAELLDLKANPDRPADGTIIEAKFEQGRGAVATVLVQRGTLRVGDIFVAGAESGRVRALIDDHGENVKDAGPGSPVEVIGFTSAPSAGDDFVVVDSEPRAREIAEFRGDKERKLRTAANARGTLEEMFERIQTGEVKDLPVIVKADVQGSVEAVVGVIDRIKTDEVKVQILHRGAGGINESDVTLAGASRALIIGFNVRANKQARDLAKVEGVDIRYYSVIYDVAEDIRQLVVGMMAPTLRENFLGNAEIREVFSVSKVGKVAGCFVREGTVKRGAKVRLLRDDVVIHEGSLSTLKRFKDDVREVKEGYECGMSFENYQDIKEGDVIECFEVQEIAATL
jgi:translation initiation factor IF-2